MSDLSLKPNPTPQDSQAYVAAAVRERELSDEAADVFIILLGLCNLLGIDLEQAVRGKEEKNKRRQWK